MTLEARFRWRAFYEEDDGDLLFTIRKQTKGGIDNEENDARRLEDQRLEKYSFEQSALGKCLLPHRVVGLALGKNHCVTYNSRSIEIVEEEPTLTRFVGPLGKTN